MTHPAPHDLVRIRTPEDLMEFDALPDWAIDTVRKVPWVVVRRAPQADFLIPVGIRGKDRSVRAAAFLSIFVIEKTVTPYDLAEIRPWRIWPRRMPAIEILDQIASDLAQFDLQWGPTGSVGFELATGHPSVENSSDLDLLIRMERPIALNQMRQIAQQLTRTDIRIDAQLETSKGAIALSEYVRGEQLMLLRTINGPRLISIQFP
jgi:phosphoribosyl-dephospho-CoA transferase